MTEGTFHGTQNYLDFILTEANLKMHSGNYDSVPGCESNSAADNLYKIFKI